MSSAPPAHCNYRAPRWLPGGHAQTIFAATLAKLPTVSYSRDQWETPDFDFIDLDWLDAPDQNLRVGEEDCTPLVVMFHGLEGSSGSPYARTLMHETLVRGWRGVVVHFRGCGGQVNRLPRAYHSGDSAEIDWILRRLRSMRSGPIFVMGVSLGGNVLLKWLGEQGEAAHEVITRAAAVSAPVDLAAAGVALARGFNLVYTRNFLATMKAKTAAKMKRYPALCDAGRMRAARTLRAFDDLLTAPLHGFEGVDDYYVRASSKPYLNRIAVPTLMLNAKNDPFLPARFLPAQEEVSSAVRLEQPDTGGHVGFTHGPYPGDASWLARHVLDFLSEYNHK
jgi:predicted alpha/beta-fold hydrolase